LMSLIGQGKLKRNRRLRRTIGSAAILDQSSQ
jgi:hypothetical protein